VLASDVARCRKASLDVVLKPRKLVLCVRQGLDATVEIVLRGTKINSVLDSCSQVSILCSELARGLDLERCCLQLVDVNGQNIAIDGQIELEFSIGSRKLRQVFIVAPIVSSVLLGMDFLQRHDCLVDYKRMVLTVDKTQVGLHSNGHCSISECLQVSSAARGRVSELVCARCESRPIDVLNSVVVTGDVVDSHDILINRRDPVECESHVHECRPTVTVNGVNGVDMVR